MWINEIENSLPNGFHDSILEKVELDYITKRFVMTICVDVSDASKNEDNKYRKIRLEVDGLGYFSVEPPTEDAKADTSKGLWMSGTPTECIKAKKNGFNVYCFFLHQLNSFIHLTGQAAKFTWIE